MREAKKLGELKYVEFIGGLITKRIEADTKKGDQVIDEVSVITPKAINGGKIEKEFLHSLQYKTEFDRNRLTQEGDVVLKFSTPYDAAYVTKEEAELLLPSYCLILRIKDKTKLNPRFLTAFINSEIYGAQIKRMLSGADAPMLTIGKIKDVEIAEFTIEEQDEIAEFYKNLCEKESIMKQIIELEKERITSVLGGITVG